MSGIPAPRHSLASVARCDSPSSSPAASTPTPTPTSPTSTSSSSPQVTSRIATSRLQPRRSILTMSSTRTSTGLPDARSASPALASSPSPASQLSPPRATAPPRASTGAGLTSKSSISSLGVAAAAAAASGGGIPKTPRRSLAPSTTTTTALPDPFSTSLGSRSAPRKSGVGFSSTLSSHPPPPLPSQRNQVEIGDPVRFDNGPQSLQGVVRFLGPIEGKAGYWAGLELTGESTGKGKNDGTVAGVQYFACRPLDGVFCPAHKLVLLSSTPSIDAVPRPHSALSTRSGRESSMSLRGGGGGVDEDGEVPSSSGGLPMRTPARKRSGTHQGPPIAYPGLPSTTNTTTTSNRPLSRTSGRMTPTTGLPSATSRPTSALSHTSTSSMAAIGRSSSRLGPRKSVVDLAADEEARRRQKSSAEAAAEAERRITKGSRADRLRNMRADELLASKRAAAATAAAETSKTTTTTGIPGRTRPSSPSKGRPSSPLKETLLAPNRPRSSMGASLSGGGGGGGVSGMTKGRTSLAGSGALGAGGLPTPKMAKGRVSMFARPPSSLGSTSTADMPPPALGPTKAGTSASASATTTNTTANETGSSPAKGEMRRSWSGGNGRPASSLSSHEAEAFWNAPSTSAKLHRFSVGAEPLGASRDGEESNDDDAPRTPSKASRRLSSNSVESSGNGDVQATIRKAKERTHAMLLQEMDLTPRKAAAASSSSPFAAALGGGVDGDGHGTSDAHVLVADGGGGTLQDEFVAEPVVALRVYEELNEELRLVKEELEAARRLAQVEREKGVAEARKEMEEEREVERRDEARRKKANEEREEGLRKELESAQRERRKLGEEMEKVRIEGAKMVRERESKLEESEGLVRQLKETIEKGEREMGREKEQEDGRIGAKDAEIAQLQNRVKRIEEEFEKERRELLGQIDELKDAGEEAMSLMESTLREEQDHHRAQLEEVKIQAEKLILKAEQEKAAALTEASTGARGGGIHGDSNGGPESAAEIDNQNLREQVAHLQGKIHLLEDEVAELQQAAEEDKESTMRKRDKLVENEAKLRQEVTKLKAEVNKVNLALAESKTQVGELHEALQESRARLESERAELETLRAEAEHGLPSSASPAASAAARGDGEKSRLEAEVERLTGLLEGARSGRHEAQRQVELLKKQVEDQSDLLEELRAQLKSLEAEQQQTTTTTTIAKSTKSSSGDRPPSYMSSGASPNLAATSPGIERVTPSPKRLSTTSNTSRRSRSSLVGGASTLVPDQQKELSGLRSLVASTSEENARLKQEVLEARLELEDAKERIEALETASGSVSSGPGQTADDASASSLQARLEKLASEKVSLEKRLRESDKELTKLRTKLEEAQQEINDLEALCESAVYRRDEREAESSQLQRKVEKLMREMERMRVANEANAVLLRDANAKEGEVAEGEIDGGKKKEKANEDPTSEDAVTSNPSSSSNDDERQRVAPPAPKLTSSSSSDEATQEPTPDPTSTPTSIPTSTSTSKPPQTAQDPPRTNPAGQKWCDDCEEYGDHDLEHCPMSELF